MVALFNANDNLQAFRHSTEEPPGGANDLVVLNRIQIMFHDYNCNGVIDSSTSTTTIPETPVTQPFVLISAGRDGVFGPVNYTPNTGNPQANQDAVQDPKQCDDITNFQ